MTKSALVGKIQRYSTKDGPGLRTTVFLSGCNLACLWCANPDLIPASPQVFYYPERCTQCGRCVEMADNESIRFAKVGVTINREECTNVLDCAKACYFDAYEINARELTSTEVIKEILKDKTYYDQSGGGVTFSGGEPLLHEAFLLEVLPVLKEQGIHVAIDTAGLIPQATFAAINPYTDLYLFDTKAHSDTIHRTCTAVSNSTILRNAEYLAKLGKTMHIRMIIVPTYNDDPEDLKARLDFIASLGDAVERLDILPYHFLGEGKYRALGLAYPLHGLKPLDIDALKPTLAYAEALGLNYDIHQAL